MTKKWIITSLILVALLMTFSCQTRTEDESQSEAIDSEKQDQTIPSVTIQDTEDSDLQTISAQADDRPVINEFYADPNVVMAAASAILHWSVDGASTVVIEPDIGDVSQSGERGVNPLESTTYVLTASNEAGNTTASAEVSSTGIIATVAEVPPVVLTEFEEPPNPPEPLDPSGIDGIAWVDAKTQEPVLRSLEFPETQQVGGVIWLDLETQEPIIIPSEGTPAVLPIIRYFEASPTSSIDPTWVTFWFDVPNATRIYCSWLDVTGRSGYSTLVYGDSYADFVYPFSDAFYFTGGVHTTTTFTLHAYNSTGVSTESLTVEIEQVEVREVEVESAALPTIHFFTADPGGIAEGDRSRLGWEVSNADFVNIACDDFISAGLPSTGSLHVSPTETRLYTLSATNTAGTANEEVTITVERTPYITTPATSLPIIHSFTADPEDIIAYHDSSLLRWQVSNSDGIIVSSGDKILINNRDPSITTYRVWPVETTTYQLTAYNTAGTRTSENTVTVEPGILPFIISFTADPEYIAAGEQSRLSWEVFNADSIAIQDTWGYVWIPDLPLSGSVYVEPTVTLRYWLLAENGEYYRWEQVWVLVEEPIIHSFSADPSYITVGELSRLSWAVSNADLITIAYNDTEIGDLPLSGSLHIGPIHTTVYHLNTRNTVWWRGNPVYRWQRQEITVNVQEPEPPPPPPPPELKSDLVIKDIWRSGTNQWYYIIENQGEEDSKASTTALMIDGEPHTSHAIGSLAVGESREVYFTYSFSCVAGTSHSWMVVANADSNIDESNEANNSYTEKFTCPK
jgi:hypothetical protein